MIECNEDINFDNQEYEEETDNEYEEETDVVKESIQAEYIPMNNLQELANDVDISRIAKSRVSSKVNDNINKFDKLTDKINKFNTHSKPIKVTRIKPVKFDPTALTKTERVSRSSARRSSSVLNLGSKTANIDRILEEQVTDENFEIKSDAKSIVIKGKKQKEIVLPFCIRTEHSLSTTNPKISEYYSKKRSKPVTKIDVSGQMIDNTEIESLRMMISIFLQLDEHCATLAAESKAYREEKKQYEEYILDIMQKCNQERVPHNDKVIRREVKEFRPKPKESDILQTLITIFNDENVAVQVVKAINESVPLDEKVALKQDKRKVPKAVKKIKK